MPFAHLVGIFPRSEALVDATRQHARKRLDAASLDIIVEEDARKVVALQAEAGLDYVTDGQLRWQDLLRPLSDGLEGVHAGAVTRWFDNNTFYRRPVVERSLRPDGEAALAHTVRTALDGLPWKAVLPSPWAFVALAENHAYRDDEAFLNDVADVLRAEVRTLTVAGCRYVQFSDPVLVTSPDVTAVERAGRALARVVDGVDARTGLHTFFGDAAPLLPALLDFPVDEVGFDLFATDVDRVEGNARGKVVLVGALDGRNSLLEDAAETAAAVRHVGERLGADDVAVVPSCDLEFLPWEVAAAKVRLLGEVKATLEGRS